MPTGRIKFFNKEKAYGFIEYEQNEIDIFVHITGLIDKVSKGDIVNFDIIEGAKGCNAVNVILVSKK